MILPQGNQPIKEIWFIQHPHEVFMGSHPVLGQQNLPRLFGVPALVELKQGRRSQVIEQNKYGNQE